MSLERMDETWCKGTHIYIRNLGKMNGSGGYQRKTNIYEVLTADNTKLGEIRWYASWRKYCFFPWTDTLYEETCLRDISQFIEEETAAHRTKKKAAKA